MEKSVSRQISPLHYVPLEMTAVLGAYTKTKKGPPIFIGDPSNYKPEPNSF